MQCQPTQRVPVWNVSRMKFRDEHRLRMKGRWGPAWLHRLMWRVVNNLGMIEHPTVTEETVDFVDFIPRNVTPFIAEASLQYQRRGYELSDLMAYCGPEFMGLALRDIQHMALPVPVEIGSTIRGYRHLEIRGIPLVVMPEVKGCIVVPKWGKVR